MNPKVEKTPKLDKAPTVEKTPPVETTRNHSPTPAAPLKLPAPEAVDFDHRRATEVLNQRHEQQRDFLCDLRQSENKFYALAMFPYPSGNAHMGHVLVYSISDVVARHAKLKGANVLNPIGWDAFGLPAENAAIKAGVSPAKWTRANIDRMRNEQFKDMGWSFDMTKEINTCDPLYYANTQRLFLLLHRMGLAYQKEGLVNWDPVDKTVLANEQVIDGRSWRSNAIVEKRWMNQWFFKVEDYRERLWSDLDTLTQWPASALAVQRNWINKSTGTTVKFSGADVSINVFTTRVDTLFGVSAIVLAPEHALVRQLVEHSPSAEIKNYVQDALKRSAVDRVSTNRTGVDTGLGLRHPLTGEVVPVWIGDYVLGEVGTGAVMCVPAHDERDFAFAKNYNLPIKRVVDGDTATLPFIADGVIVNSAGFSGLSSADARTAITQALKDRMMGEEMTTYNLRDWSVGRQRYWGAPIPIIHCGDCGAQPVPERDLPVLLPENLPEIDGRRQLSNSNEFMKAPCPCCGKEARRETDTLDTFVCSSWYAFRFLDPKNPEALFNSKNANGWMPLDFYVGGLEHAAQHMIYFRFITKVLHDAGMISFDEPVKEFFCNGVVKKDGHKMSKSRGNVVVPTEIVAKYGGDALRMYVLSDTPADMNREWLDSGIEAKRAFLGNTYRVLDWFLATYPQTQGEATNDTLSSYSRPDFLRRFYSSIEKLDVAFESRRLNGAVAKVHEITGLLLDELKSAHLDSRTSDIRILRNVVHDYLVATSPLVPYMNEAILLEHYPGSKGIYSQQWPSVDPAVVKSTEREIVVQVNGKKRGVLSAPTTASPTEIEELAKNDPELGPRLADQTIRKIIHVPGKLVNFVL